MSGRKNAKPTQRRLYTAAEATGFILDNEECEPCGSDSEDEFSAEELSGEESDRFALISYT